MNLIIYSKYKTDTNKKYFEYVHINITDNIKNDFYYFINDNEYIFGSGHNNNSKDFFKITLRLITNKEYIAVYDNKYYYINNIDSFYYFIKTVFNVPIINDITFSSYKKQAFIENDFIHT